MHRVRRDPNEFGATAFLKGRASQEAHQLVLFASPQFRHTAFRVETLNDLRRFHRLIRDRGVPIEASFNHGASLAFYFRDPEENLIEIYWDTGARNHQPYGDPLDLTQPEGALLQEVAAIAGPGPSNDPPRAGTSLTVLYGPTLSKSQMTKPLAVE